MRLHHVAYVTHSIEQKATQLASLGLRPSGETIVDVDQGVRIQFMEAGDGQLLELLEPYGEKSPVQRHLDNGGGLYHLCFEVADLDAELKALREAGRAIILRNPIPAPAIEGRRVAFVLAGGDLVELVEARSP
jgi:methylmalonyl-CoA/ethylmalonyl-CoA epimerase